MQSQSIIEVGKTNPVMEVGSFRRADASTAQYAAPTSNDRVEISSKGEYVSSLASRVRELPDTRGNLVQVFKEKVAAGNYPPPSIVNGFTKLIGAELAKSDTSLS